MVDERSEAQHEADSLERTLIALEHSLREQGAPLANHLNPGLTDSEIDRLLEAEGIELSETSRRLFRWHNGATATSPESELLPFNHETDFPTGFRFYSLQQLLNYWKNDWSNACELAAEDSSPELEEFMNWGPSWFPVLIDGTSNRHCVTVIPDGRWTGNEEIWLADLPVGSRLLAPSLPSLVALFDFLRIWLSQRIIYWNSSAELWDYSDGAQKATLRATWWW